MNRKQRLAARNNRNAGCLKTAQALDKAMENSSIPVNERNRFLDWAVSTMYEKFKEERMNKRILTENEIRNLGLHFPNGTVKKEYYTTFELPTDKISNIELCGASEIGLTFIEGDNGKCTLQGTPAQAGDFTLTLRYTTAEGEPTSELSIPIAFNPNPRELWKNIPTDKNIPHYKPDSDCSYIKVASGADGTPRKDIVAASQRGRSHAQEGKPRDDHYSIYHCTDSDWYIIAVADGAGSAKLSRKGSEVACEAVISHCRSMLTKNDAFEQSIMAYATDRDNSLKRTDVTRHVIDIIYKGALKAHEAVKQAVSANEGSILKDFATTLMFAVCKKYDFGWFIASFWVGDGAMCLYDRDTGTVKLLGTPDEGEFSGQTRFLTMPEIFHDPEVVTKRMRLSIVPDFTALFLVTDGVSDPMFETDRNLNDYNCWEKFYSNLRNGFPDDGIGGVDLTDDNEASKEQLLKWLDFWSPGNHDDRTIAILY